MPINNQIFNFAFFDFITGDSDQVFGNFNTLNLTNSLVFGDDNKVTGSHDWVFGTGNTVNGNINVIVGDGNTVSGSGDYVHGSNSGNITGNGNAVIGDHNHKISGTGDIVEGSDNVLVGSGGGVIGNDNHVTGDNETVTGDHNTVNGTGAQLGQSNTCVNGYANSIQMSAAEDLTLAGDSNTIHFSYSGASTVEMSPKHYGEILDVIHAGIGNAVISGFGPTDQIAVDQFHEKWNFTYTNVNGQKAVDMHITGDGIMFDAIFVGATVEEINSHITPLRAPTHP
jgi:hypothetical protein